MQEEDEKMEDRNWTYLSCTVGVPGRSRGRRELGFPSCPGGTWCFPPAPLAGQCAAASPWTPPGSPLAAGGKTQSYRRCLREDCAKDGLTFRHYQCCWPFSLLLCQAASYALLLMLLFFVFPRLTGIFSYATLSIWSSLLFQVRSVNKLVSFESSLESHFLKLSYWLCVHVCICTCLLTCLPACVYVCEICFRPFWFFAL